ncbi:hypothetical protein AB0G40_41910, partial [Streptomyces griseorubiginosus]
MIRPVPVFRESSAEPRTESLPFSHLSLEIGHLYMEDIVEGPERLRRAPREALIRSVAMRAAS